MSENPKIILTYVTESGDQLCIEMPPGGRLDAVMITLGGNRISYVRNIEFAPELRISLVFVDKSEHNSKIIKIFKNAGFIVSAIYIS